MQTVALITGAARRVGATIARYLHQQGINIVIHYHTSENEAQTLCAELNATRSHSAIALKADLQQTSLLPGFIEKAANVFGQLDVLVNNASSFYPTPIGSTTETQWENLLATNLKAPFFLAQAATPWLAKQKGCIVNIADIHGRRPLSGYSVYCIAKAGLIMLTKSLAKELGPNIRVNAIAPGPILWPEGENKISTETQHKIIAHTSLKRAGEPADIAKTVWFFVSNANYISGQVIDVDGGRALTG